MIIVHCSIVCNIPFSTQKGNVGDTVEILDYKQDRMVNNARAQVTHKAVELCIQSGSSEGTITRMLGRPSRIALGNWYKE